MRHHHAVLMQLGVIEAAFHAKRVTAEGELELDAHGRARLRAQVANRFLVTPGGEIAVDRPGNRLEQRRLAGAVGPDDPGDAVAEHDLRVGVLPEVDEAEALQLHAGLSALAADSRYSTPSFTNVSRFSSASSGRPPRNSRNSSVRLRRRAPPPPPPCAGAAAPRPSGARRAPRQSAAAR